MAGNSFQRHPHNEVRNTRCFEEGTAFLARVPARTPGAQPESGLTYPNLRLSRGLGEAQFDG